MRRAINRARRCDEIVVHPISDHRMWLNFGLSEIILALHQGNYNGPYLKPPMDL